MQEPKMNQSAPQPQTPTRSPVPPDNAQLPSIPENGKVHPPRRSSLGGLLRRSKSSDPMVKRSSSGNRLTKKEKQAKKEQELQRQRDADAVPKLPPKLPTLYKTPEIQSFGGENAKTQSINIRASHNFSRGSSGMYSSSAPGGVPIPPVPGSPRSDYDPYARTESMTHRGRYSYASSAISTVNSPRRVRRRKDPTPFNILVIGTRNSGKTSFLNFLRTSLALPAKKRVHGIVDDIILPQSPVPASEANSGFISHYLETEIDGERIGLTLWDSQGLEKNVVDLQLRETSAFLESKFEDTFTEEMKVVRAPGVQDTHIHCAFLLLDPVRLDSNIVSSKNVNGAINGTYASTNSRIVGSLDEDLDLQVLRTLQGKTTVVPVISKADTITTAHMSHLKKTVWDSLKKANLDPLEALGLDDFDGSTSSNRSSRIEEKDEEDASDGGSILIRQSTDELTHTLSNSTPNHHKRISSGSLRNLRLPASPKDGAVNGIAEAQTPYLPLSIISPDIYDPGTIGRKFPWGFADPYNEEHCDFVRLKEAVFTEWRGELREASRELWYEGWRTSRLKKRGGR